MESITIATSIAPCKALENQKSAIRSWQEIGFIVVSLNSADEIPLLQPHFPTIQFVQVSRDARKKFGKPYVYFDDVLAYLGGNESRICGIVNSDIHLLRQDFYSCVKKEAIHSLLYGFRVDVDTLENLQGEMLRDGFDYFFFDKQIIQHYPQSELFIGLPVWDYWAAIVPLFYGIPVKKVMTPHAYHIKHEVNWGNQASAILFKSLMLQYFRSLTTSARSPYYMLGLIHKYSAVLSLDHGDIDKSVLSTFHPNIKQIMSDEVNVKMIDDLIFLGRGKLTNQQMFS
jgi:hypothetical protein